MSVRDKCDIIIGVISNYDTELDLTKQNINKPNFNVKISSSKELTALELTNLEINAFFSIYIYIYMIMP